MQRQGNEAGHPEYERAIRKILKSNKEVGAGWRVAYASREEGGCVDGCGRLASGDMRKLHARAPENSEEGIDLRDLKIVLVQKAAHLLLRQHLEARMCKRVCSMPGRE